VSAVTDISDLEREWDLFREEIDPICLRVLEARDPWDSYGAACDCLGVGLLDEWLPHGGGVYVAWAELTDLFETGKTNVDVAHNVLRRAAEQWLQRPPSPSVEFIEEWVQQTREAVALRFRLDGSFWTKPPTTTTE
jgi:hypothetical protein